MADIRRVRRTRSFVARPAICPFCKGNMKVDYKDISVLSRYISSQGKIVSRRRSRACAKHQRNLAHAIKRARYLAMLPYAPTHIWKTGGVGLSRSAV
ncbi:MAG: 30S ribosomal protein S18 [Dehalococcoidia bacterium]|nr:MAG: 30S ribosomal protein S18 [Dehalococcoidia bacterium]